ncbi:helix-turn-helix domain-containing protein [Caballeronia sp. PC1]|nr:helix-turn-helix domain-containing protein [Caballeronia sp. PC1]EKS70270.1 AraC family transcriptional regulator [Burkholderia sp. SJ98]MCE4546457.1 helix-turn-helix domain-containing protein [Caballeronia sp. PC1]
MFHPDRSGGGRIEIKGQLALSELRTYLTLSHGLGCKPDKFRPYNAEVRAIELGETAFSTVRMTALTLFPDNSTQEHSQHIYVKLVSQGKLLFEQDGDRKIVAAGELVIVDPSMPFTETFQDETSLIVLRCKKSSLQERGFRCQLSHCIEPDMSSADVSVVFDMIRAVASNFAEMRYTTQALLGSHLIDWLGVLLESSGAAGSRSTTAAYHRAKRHIANHLGEESLDAHAIASAAGVSVSYLNRLFHDEGTSLMRYLWGQRLERARQLIEGICKDGIRIEEVAWRCGFASAAHFSRRFRQHFGHSPTEWRERAGSFVSASS